MSRKTNILTYLNEWHDGMWYLRKPEDIGIRVADEAVAFAGLDDTRQNQQNYAEVVDEMIADEELTIEDHGNGWITINVPGSKE